MWRTGWCLLSSGVVLFWALVLTLIAVGRRHYPSLAGLDLAPIADAELPTLSILVPACNEAATLEPALRSLLALDYPNLEIVAINDRSTDETGAILERVAACDPRIRVQHITELPSGWLGKNHALQVASEMATGAWLLFTDADVHFAPDALRRGVAYAQQQRLDHLAAVPQCETQGFWERVFVSYFSVMFTVRVRPWEVSNLRRSAFVGLGAFNLVRAAAYRQAGGHRALPLEVLDDMKLGKVLKRAGFQPGLVDGVGLLSVRWVMGLSGVIRGLDKNAFAGLEFRLPSLVSSILGLLVTGLYPLLALASPLLAVRLLALLALGLMVIVAGFFRRVSGAGRWFGLTYPLAALVLCYAMLRSTVRAYRQKGIWWRGTLYSLSELRRGVV